MAGESLKAKIESGAVVSGPIVAEIRSPGGIKALALAGHDFVWLDMEHAMYDWATVHGLVQYARAVGIAPLVRVTDLSYAAIARALDTGAVGVVVPRVETVSQVEEAVGCALYPPLGRRGAGGEARVLYEPTTPADAITRIGAETVVVVQVETVGAVARIDAIAAVPGVDVVCVGPQDLSISLGIPGQFDNPQFVGAVTHVIERTVVAGKAAGMVERAAGRFERWHAAGARFMACNTDLNMLGTAARADVAALQALPDG